MSLALITIFLPLLTAGVALVITRKYSWMAPLIGCLIMMISTTTTVLLLVRFWNSARIFSFHWIKVANHEINLVLDISNTTLLISLLVAIISFAVHVYSTGYMADDRSLPRYYGMLGLFTFSMQVIVFSGNLLVLFFGWELVGFCSYMLIGHGRENPAAASAATRAFIFNRIGDAGFLVGLMLLWARAGTFEIHQLQSLQLPAETLSLISGTIFLGVIGKSAQFPLFTWLPDAMEGPIPVSALIHAATMVSAGVFLMARIFFLFTADSLLLVSIIGALTSFIGAFEALRENNIKKILAYSTISQLGLMIMALGNGAVAGSVLHLVTHGFFKAGLFLAAGVLIFGIQRDHADSQDIRNLKGLRKGFPFTLGVMLIYLGALAGIPFTSGFLSKEVLFAGIGNSVFIIFYFLITALTTLYAMRLAGYLHFSSFSISEPKGNPVIPAVMRWPLVLFALGSAWICIGFNPFNPDGWMLNGIASGEQAYSTFLAIGWSLFWVVVGYFIFRHGRTMAVNLLPDNLGLNQFYEIGVYFPVKALANLSHYIDHRVLDGVIHGVVFAKTSLAHLSGWFDRTILNGAVDGFGHVSLWAGGVVRSSINGKIQNYLWWSVALLTIFIIWQLQ